MCLLLSAGQIHHRESGRPRKMLFPAAWCCLLLLSGCSRCAGMQPEGHCPVSQVPVALGCGGENIMKDVSYCCYFIISHCQAAFKWSAPDNKLCPSMVFLYQIVISVNPFLRQCFWFVYPLLPLWERRNEERAKHAFQNYRVFEMLNLRLESSNHRIIK